MAEPRLLPTLVMVVDIVTFAVDTLVDDKLDDEVEVAAALEVGALIT